jgi:carbonic anhydrase
VAGLDELFERNRVCAVAMVAEDPGFFTELNVIEQVANVCQTTIVEDAWARAQDVRVHGVVYGLEDGLLRDLDVSTSHGANHGC